MENHIEEQYKCRCHTHSIEVVKFQDEDEVYIEFWNKGFRFYSLLKRLKIILKILKNGNFLQEEVILDPPQAKELGNLLIQVSEPTEKD